MRGYAQFRFSEVAQGEGPDLEVPADRSVNENESFVMRRGRFVMSGDVSEHLALYAQADFNASTGAADYSLQMRDLYADVNLDKEKAFRVRLGQSKVPYGWVNMQSSQNRAPFERADAINSAVEGERDYGMYLMWASPAVRQRYRDLVSLGLKGSGDYGSVAVGSLLRPGPESIGSERRSARARAMGVSVQAVERPVLRGRRAGLLRQVRHLDPGDHHGRRDVHAHRSSRRRDRRTRGPDGGLVSATDRRRGRVECRPRSRAQRGLSHHRQQVAEWRLRAGELSPGRRAARVVPVRPLAGTTTAPASSRATRRASTSTKWTSAWNSRAGRSSS